MSKTKLHHELKIYKKNLYQLSGLLFLTGLCISGFAFNFAKLLNDVFLNDLDLKKAAPLLGALLSLVFLRLLLDIWQEKCALKLSLAIQESLRLRLNKKLLSLNPLDLSKQQTGEFISLAANGVDELDGFFRHFVPQVLAAIILPFVLLCAALAADPLTALIFFITAPLIPFLLYLVGRLAAKASADQWRVLSSLSRSFFELLQGLTTLKIFNRSRQQLELVDELSDTFRTATLNVLRIAFLSAFVLELIATLSIALVSVSIGLRLLNGSMEFTAAFFALLLAPEFYRPLRQCASAFHQAMTALTAANKIYDFLDVPSSSKQMKKAAIKKTPSPFSIRFENVNFAYNKQADLALKNLSFTLKAGTTNALVGRSGAGKSTIFQLLLRFIEPSQGKIFVNDIELSQINPDFWRTRIAYVPQEPYIFRATIAENIALANPAATHAQIETAAKAANLHDSIMEMKNGYDTKLAGRNSLSGGQGQRLAIARAFLRDCPLLLLDEPTAKLDEKNEQAVLTALQKLSYGKTVLIASHKMSLARSLSSILVIEDGQLSENGSHEKLWQNQGLYFELTHAQGGIS